MAEDAEYYRAQAELCRTEASTRRGEPAAAWLKIATEYDRLAEMAEGMSRRQPPFWTTLSGAQRQPAQQQQSKINQSDGK